MFMHGQFAIRLLNVGTMLRHLRLCCNCVALKIVVAYRPVYYHLYLQALMAVFYDVNCISVDILPWL